MNEDKVREAIKEIKTWGFAPLPVDMIVAKLEQSIAPPKPEIPEGCPVLVWDKGEKLDAFYVRCDLLSGGHIVSVQHKHSVWPSCEIDYQRAEKQFKILTKLLDNHRAQA